MKPTFSGARLLLLGVVLVAVGICLVIARAFTGDPIPYAPGDDTPSARAAARTASGYTSESVTVYEGDVSAVREIPLAGPDSQFPYEYVSLSSGVSGIDVQGSDRQPPPSLSVGQVVRIWTTTSTGTFAWRVDAAGSTWIGSGFIPKSIPRQFEGGFAPAKTAIYWGGVPGGLLLGFSGLILLYMRPVQASSNPWRRVDHVAIWSPVIAVLVGVLLVLSVRGNGVVGALPLLFLALVSLFAGVVAGIIGLATRKAQNRWWPSVIGIVTCGGMLLLAVIVGANILSNPCGFTYC